MFYYIKKCRSKTVHLKGCRHIGHCADAEIGTFIDLTQADLSGYRLCNHCNLIQKQYKAEEEKILDICQKYGFSYYQRDRIATVTTTVSKWKITVNNVGTQMNLYHRNSFDIPGEVSIIPNYHYQNVTYKNIIGFLDYILRHDIYRKKHPLEENKKVNTPPPIKGTKRYRKEKKKLERKTARIERRNSITRVLSLIESLQSG